MICPLQNKIEVTDWQRDCVTTECAWWDSGNNCCVMKSLLIELIKVNGD
jgi:hypothetical protein